MSPLRVGDQVCGIDVRHLYRDPPTPKCGIVEEILDPDPDVPGELARVVIRDRTRIPKTISWPLVGRQEG